MCWVSGLCLLDDSAHCLQAASAAGNKETKQLTPTSMSSAPFHVQNGTHSKHSTGMDVIPPASLEGNQVNPQLFPVRQGWEVG